MLTRENFRGCVIGQSVADALGMPVERQSPAQCQDYIQQLRAGKVGHVHHPLYAFGQYTDDSQLMRELLSSFVACEDFEPEDYARRIAKIHITYQIIGCSSASRKVASRLLEGTAWNEAGTPAPYARNGSAMRAAPIGLFFNSYPEQLFQAACDQAQITHQDPRSLAGSVAIASAVAFVVQCNELVHTQFLNYLSQQIEPLDVSFSKDILRLADWLELPFEKALQEIAVIGNPPPSLDDREGITPWIIPSVLWSLYSFLKSPDSYIEAVYTAASGGGDADTTAAMAGAISGAYLGENAVPTAIAYRLTDQGRWGYEPLLALLYQRCLRRDAANGCDYAQS